MTAMFAVLNDVAHHLEQRAADTAAAAIGHGAELRVRTDGRRLLVALDDVHHMDASRLVGAGWEPTRIRNRYELTVYRNNKPKTQTKQ